MDHAKFLITITSSTTSIGGLIVGCVTKSNIAWAVGIMAGCAAVFTAYLNWRKDKRDKAEKAISIENLAAQRDYYRQKYKNISEKAEK